MFRGKCVLCAVFRVCYNAVCGMRNTNGLQYRCEVRIPLGTLFSSLESLSSPVNLCVFQWTGFTISPGGSIFSSSSCVLPATDMHNSPPFPSSARRIAGAVSSLASSFAFRRAGKCWMSDNWYRTHRESAGFRDLRQSFLVGERRISHRHGAVLTPVAHFVRNAVGCF